MKTFHGKQSIKDKYIERVKAHAAADRIIKGRYWENGKGCAIGCTIEGGDHEKYETELGIPREIAYLEDIIFEKLPNNKAMEFPLRFLEAVPVGVDLSKVIAQLIIWQFEDEKYGLKNIKEVVDDKVVYEYCQKVVALYKRILENEKVDKKEFDELYKNICLARATAGTDAWAEAWAEAWAMAGAWSGSRAMAGAWSGSGTMAWARAGAWGWAGAKEWAWGWAGAREWANYDNRMIVMADKFIELIKGTKV